MLQSTLTITAAILISVVQPYPNRGYQQSSSRLSRCVLPNNPCRQYLEVRNSSGHITSTREGAICSCNAPEVCSTDWSDQTHAINRTLISTTGTTNLNLMFCGNIQASRDCVGDEYAMELTSYLLIPTDLENNFCNCPSTEALQLRRRARARNYKYHHFYVCASAQPTCSAGQTCVTIGSQATEYPCKCPASKRCNGESATLDSQTGLRHGSCVDDS